MFLNKFKICCVFLFFINSCLLFADSVTDKDIDTQLDMLYKKNSILKKHTICSKTKNQQVVLKGSVQNPTEKELAEDLASLVDFIDKIDNQIKVNPKLNSPKNKVSLSDHVSDTLTSHLVHSKLILHPELQDADIKAKCLNGICILRGQVSSLDKKHLAYKIALSTRGVVDVVNKISSAE